MRQRNGLYRATLLAMATMLGLSGCAQMFNSGLGGFDADEFDAEINHHPVDAGSFQPIQSSDEIAMQPRQSLSDLQLDPNLPELVDTPTGTAPPRRLEPIVDHNLGKDPEEQVGNENSDQSFRPKPIILKAMADVADATTNDFVAAANRQPKPILATTTTRVPGSDFVPDHADPNYKFPANAIHPLAAASRRSEANSPRKCDDPHLTESTYPTSPVGITANATVEKNQADCIASQSSCQQNNCAVDNSSTAECQKLVGNILSDCAESCEECDSSCKSEAIEESQRTANPIGQLITTSIEMGAAHQATFQSAVDAAARELVRSESKDQQTQLNWRSQLSRTIEVFEAELAKHNGESETSDRLQTGLSILKALESGFSIETGQGSHSQEELRLYWSHQIDAINELLKTSSSVSGTAASTALHHLQSAVHELAAIADLSLPFAVFCNKVTGFGQFRTFDSSEFDANQNVLVYCEIDNFAPLLETKDGVTNYQTQLSSAFWITNGSNEIVQQQDFPVVTDNARNLRRDFFMHLPVTFADLPPGEYELQVEVRDHGSDKTGRLDQPLRFSIK